jgi:aspartate kinase
MKDIAVLKFGGTSVKNIGRIRHVAEIVAATEARKKLVVVSAMGDTTDYLYELSKQCCDVPDKRELDQLLSTGEQVSIALLALTLKSLGINARSFTGAQIGIRTDGRYNEARILDFDKSSLQSALSQCDVAVIAGFQGLAENGEVTTLGRGGSDTTAVAVAVAAGADECDIYTDVDGVFTADPNKIPAATLLPVVSFDHVLTLAQSGAQVIHPRAVELGRAYGVRLRIRNTFNPSHNGTLITGAEDMENIESKFAVAVENSQALCTLAGIRTGQAVFNDIIKQLVAENIAVDAFAQAPGSSPFLRNLLFAVKCADVDRACAILSYLGRGYGAADTIVDSDIAKVSLVGAGLGNRPLLTADVLGLLEGAGIEIKLITSADNRVCFFVPKLAAQAACRLIHDHVCTKQLVAA